jgi:hypothetical protein
MLSLEVDGNLNLLKAYGEKVNEIESTDEEWDIYAERLYRLTLFPMPEFNFNAWKSQVVLLASALNKNEIKRIQSFYSYLTIITTNYSRILATGREDMQIALKERDARLAKLSVGFFLPPRVSELSWRELAELVCKVLEDSNPLHK